MKQPDQFLPSTDLHRGFLAANHLSRFSQSECHKYFCMVNGLQYLAHKPKHKYNKKEQKTCGFQTKPSE